MKKLTTLAIALTSTLLISGCSDPEAEALAAKLAHGEQIVKKTCKACHAPGINGAPIIGNKIMWGKRDTSDINVLVAHARDGYGLMPAKGGNSSLTDEDLNAAITYMLAQLEP